MRSQTNQQFNVPQGRELEHNHFFSFLSPGAAGGGAGRGGEGDQGLFLSRLSNNSCELMRSLSAPAASLKH